MKARIFIFTALAISGGDAWGFTDSQREYRHPSNGVIEYAGSREFVICANCPAPTELEVLPQVELSVRMDTKEKSRFPSPPEEAVPAPLPLPLSPATAAPPSPPHTVPPVEAVPRKVMVLFEFGSTVLSETAKAELDSLMPGKSYTVYGYTCDRGTVKANKRVAFERAKAVADYLTSKGIAVASAAGKPGCCYVRPADVLPPDTSGKVISALPKSSLEEMARAFSRRAEVIDIPANPEPTH